MVNNPKILNIKKKGFLMAYFFFKEYKFHTKQWNQHNLNLNFGVCIKAQMEDA